MMEANRDAGLQCKRLGRKYLERGDVSKAIKFLQKAKRMIGGGGGGGGGEEGDADSQEIEALLRRARREETSTRTTASSSSNNNSNSSAQRTESKSTPTTTSARPPPPPPTKRKRSKEEKKREADATCDRILANKSNLYAVLGVPRNADEKAIKTAYRKLARRFHPDKNNSAPKYTEAFKAIGQAYDTLSDKRKRSIYDAGGGVDGGARGGGGGRRHQFRTADEIFEAFFSGGPRPVFARRRRGGGRGGANDAAPAPAHQNLLQLLPILFVLLASFGSLFEGPMGGGVGSALYSLTERAPQYSIPRRTADRDVLYFVGEGAHRELSDDTSYRRRVDRAVEEDYYVFLQRKCNKEKREKRKMMHRAERSNSASLLKRAHSMRLETCEELRAVFGR